jgi:hypothetical protein
VCGSDKLFRFSSETKSYRNSDYKKGYRATSLIVILCNRDPISCGHSMLSQ